MRHVVDSCMVGPLLFPDEAQTLHLDLLGLFECGEVVVPSHWRIEIAHFSTKGLRMGRITSGDLSATLALLDTYRIIEDDQTSGHAWGRSRELGIKHHLTLYDAPYLELAMRLNLPLLTRDGALSKAARAEGMATITA